MRAFVFMPYNPGDVIMALHAAHFLHQALPHCEIDFFTSEECAALPQALPWITRTISLNRKELTSESLSSICPPEAHYDLGINLFQAKWGAYLAGFLGAHIKVGLWPQPGAGIRLHGNWLEYWMAQPVDRQVLGWHTIDFFRKAILEAIKPLLSEARPQRSHPANQPLFASPSPMVGRSSNGTASTMHLILHPGSAWPGKRWPLTSWVALAERMIEAGHVVSVTGSAEEKVWLEGMLTSRVLSQASKTAFPSPNQDTPFCFNLLAGKTTWSSLVSLYHQSDWVVSGDTVAMHLGAACGVKTVSLFGASNPRETGPYGPGHFVFECQGGPYPTALALNQTHAGLATLPTESVADFILQGKAPSPHEASHKFWETCWSPSQEVQFLRDALGQKDGLARPRFTPLTSPSFEPSDLPDALQQLIQALDLALAAGDDLAKQPSHIAAVSRAENLWSQMSAHSLPFEAYRIYVNGLPLHPLRQNLALRRARLRQAIGDFLQSTIAETLPQKTQ